MTLIYVLLALEVLAVLFISLFLINKIRKFIKEKKENGNNK